MASKKTILKKAAKPKKPARRGKQSTVDAVVSSVMSSAAIRAMIKSSPVRAKRKLPTKKGKKKS